MQQATKQNVKIGSKVYSTNPVTGLFDVEHEVIAIGEAVGTDVKTDMVEITVKQLNGRKAGRVTTKSTGFFEVDV